MIKKLLFPIITLVASVVVLIVAALGLQNVAIKNAQKEHEKVLNTLLPGNTFVLEEYVGDDENIKSVHKGETGYVIETVVYGYADNIRMMIAVDNSGEVKGIAILEIRETFGLGLRALRDTKFMFQFLGSSEILEVGSSVDAMSGATVTSKAITKAVNSAIAYVTGADIDSGASEW